MADEGRRVTVVCGAPNPGRKDTYIVAGTTIKKRTGERTPVAVRIDPDTSIFKDTGESVSAAAARELKEGEEILVQGPQTKRGVIRAKRLRVPS
jgi:hypothetical protein